MKTDKKIEEIKQLAYDLPDELHQVGERIQQLCYEIEANYTPNTEVQKAEKRAVIEYAERLGNRLIELAPVEHSTLDAITFVLNEYLYLQSLDKGDKNE